MNRTRYAAATAAALALTLAAPAAGEPHTHPYPPDPTDLTLVYVYALVDPLGWPSWENSGRQTLLSIGDGHYRPIVDPPAGVCGPGWGVQIDHVRGLAVEDVPPVVDRREDVGVLGWPPVVSAWHEELRTDPCPEPGPVPEVALPAAPVVAVPAFTG